METLVFVGVGLLVVALAIIPVGLLTVKYPRINTVLGALCVCFASFGALALVVGAIGLRR